MSDFSPAPFSLPGALVLKGGIDCSSNPDYPAAVAGDTYLITVSGMIGGGAGLVVFAGDQISAFDDNAGGSQASVGSSWFLNSAAQENPFAKVMDQGVATTDTITAAGFIGPLTGNASSSDYTESSLTDFFDNGVGDLSSLTVGNATTALDYQSNTFATGMDQGVSTIDSPGWPVVSADNFNGYSNVNQVSFMDGTVLIQNDSGLGGAIVRLVPQGDEPLALFAFAVPGADSWYAGVRDDIDSDNMFRVGNDSSGSALLFDRDGVLTCAGNSASLALRAISAPSSAVEGQIYADSNHHLFYYNGTSFLQLDSQLSIGGSPVSDGTYTVGLGVTNNGTITVSNGVITAIQEAS